MAILILNGSCMLAGQVQKVNSMDTGHINKTLNEKHLSWTNIYCQAHAQADETQSDKL